MQSIDNRDNLDWWFTSERIDTEDTANIYNISPKTLNRKRSEGDIKLDVYKLGTENFYKRSQAQADALRRVKIQLANQK